MIRALNVAPMTDAKHTPLRLTEDGNLEIEFEGEWCQIACVGGPSWGYPQQDKTARFKPVRDEYARFIVTAVNSHEDLVNALKATRLQLLQSNNDSEYAQEAIEQARAALEKAGRA